MLNDKILWTVIIGVVFFGFGVPTVKILASTELREALIERTF